MESNYIYGQSVLRGCDRRHFAFQAMQCSDTPQWQDIMLRRGTSALCLNKKKGRSGLERPKSREETPKEGYDRTSWARDAAAQ